MIRFSRDNQNPTTTPDAAHELSSEILLAIHARIRHGYYDRVEVERAIIDRLLSDVERTSTHSSDEK